MMKTLRFLALALAIGLVLSGPAHAQTLLNTITNSVALTDTTTQFTVSATTNVSVGNWLFAPITGEIMQVLRIPVSGTVVVRRSIAPGGMPGGSSLSRPYSLVVTSTLIIVTDPRVFINYDPGGSCTRGSGIAAFSPVINALEGNVWVCRSSTWNGTNLRPMTFSSLEPFTP